jgi:hypothetical protein
MLCPPFFPPPGHPEQECFPDCRAVMIQITWRALDSRGRTDPSASSRLWLSRVRRDQVEGRGVHDRTDLGQGSNRCAPVHEVLLRSSPARSQRQESQPARLRWHLRSNVSCRLQAHNRRFKFETFFFPRIVVRKNYCQPSNRCSPMSGRAGGRELLSIALGMLIGGIQLPSAVLVIVSGPQPCRDVSSANAIELSNTSTHVGGQAPFRTAAVMPVIKAITPKLHSAMLERLETKPRGVIVYLAASMKPDITPPALQPNACPCRRALAQRDTSNCRYIRWSADDGW